MPELNRFVWEWPSILERFRALNPVFGDRLARACRPISAERRPDGRLVLVLGCWVPSDREFLSDEGTIELLQRGFYQLLEERIEVLVTTWPAGDGEPDSPPDPLAGLPESVRAIGAASGGALKRSLFAALARHGLVFDCNYPVLNYRLDFALPSQRIGVEVEGWDWRAWTRPDAADRREREQSLGYEGWTVLWFTGSEILNHLDRSVDQILTVAQRRPTQAPVANGHRPRRLSDGGLG
jgi:very-short-patch-repair endonuclease